MQVFQVRHGASGAILWTGGASGEAQVLDVMAHAAGYQDRSELPDTMREGSLSVEALTFGSASDGNFRTVRGGRAGTMTARSGSPLVGGSRTVSSDR